MPEFFESLTLWHYLVGYLILAVAMILLTMCVQVLGAIGRPPSPNGHLDVNVKWNKLSTFFVLSSFLILPVVIAFDGSSFRDVDDRFQSTHTLIFLYGAIAFIWIVKMQIQINRLSQKLGDAESHENESR